MVSIDPAGVIEWNAKIPKEQVRNHTDWYDTYLLAVNGSDMFFIFNDHPDNLLYNGDGKITRMNFNKNYVALVRVDSDGRFLEKP